MFSFVKFGPTDYVIHFSQGKVRREGRGLSFFYWVPTASIVSIPVGSSDLPFVFQLLTGDFQTVTVQGQLTYRVVEPRKLADLLNFTIHRGGQHVSDDPQKLGQRLINEAQSSAAAAVAAQSLRDSLRSAEPIGNAIIEGLRTSQSVQMLGIEPVRVSIVAVTPTPEMGRALEADARERLQQEADMAIYARRNNAVAEERKIKESELNTEIAVEEKKRQIRETQTQADIAIEERRRTLVDLQAANERKAAETKAFALDAMLKPLAAIEWEKLAVLGGAGADARVTIAHAFRQLAASAERIGTLNITPDLLQSIINDERP
ncbi:MAG TPA: SPFH domain-containing protein [Thermoanaerobaculia bacterium]|nr:SPFH domain-containing protein [Thermoanaerobaculia bacterium]